MLHPLQDNVVVATRRVREYEFTTAGRVCARTRMRAATARQTLGWLGRLLGGRTAMRHLELEVCDAQGVAHWLIVLEASRGTDLRAHAALLDGTPLGNAVSGGGMFTLHRPIDLYDAAGAPIGQVVTGRFQKYSIPLVTARPRSSAMYRSPSAKTQVGACTSLTTR